jgi:polyhydroxyalkanoate synthesis regulator phasin
MKKITFFLCLMAALFLSVNVVPSHAAEVDVLINKLVEKGILTRQEAQLLLKDMQKEGARQDQAVKETAEQVAKETAEKTVKKEAASGKFASVPKWVNRIHFKGDFRLRYQYQDIKESDGTKFNRNRGRYRWRFGAIADVTADRKWQVGFGLASGSGDPRSTNQTFGNSFETPDCRIDYAYAQYKPWKFLKVVGGQMKNPLWRPKDLIWDSDIRPQGGAIPFKYKVNDMFTVFANPALFVLSEFKSEEETATMFVLQPGVVITPMDMMYVKLAGSWYYNHEVKGNQFKYSSDTNSRDANGDLLYEYSSLAFNGELGFKFKGYLQKAAIFGQYINSDADDNDSAYLVGVKFGRSIKKFADWEFKYNYRYLERDSVLDFLPDSDFYDGGTNAKGHEFEFKFGLAKHVYLALDYYYAKLIDYAPGQTDEPTNLFQFDVNFKF